MQCEFYNWYVSHKWIDFVFIPINNTTCIELCDNDTFIDPTLYRGGDTVNSHGTFEKNSLDPVSEWSIIELSETQVL